MKLAAKHFVKEGLAVGDRVAIFTISGQQVLPFSTDVSKLTAAIDKLNFTSRIPSGGLCPTITPYDAYVIANNRDQGETLEIKVAEGLRCFGCNPNYRNVGGRLVVSPGPGCKTSPDVVRRGVQVQADQIWEQVRMTSSAILGTIEDIVDYMGHMPGKRMILFASSGFRRLPGLIGCAA